jgi:predicted MPP superfamily phosphohydrolase
VIPVVVAVLVLAALVVVELGAFPAFRRRRLAIAVSLLSFVVVDVLVHWAVVHYRAGESLSVLLGLVLVTLGIAAVPIAVIVLLSWASSRLVVRRRPAPAPPPAPEPRVSRRQVVEGAGSVAVLGATGSLLGWGAARGRYDFRLVEVPVRIPGLPRALDGYAIAQVSDLHAGVHVGERTLDEGLELVKRAKADLLVATGDLVDLDSLFAPMIARKLAGVAPRDGVFAILGNHDHYAGAGGVLQALRAAGVTALVNEGHVIRAGDGGGFALLGVEDLWARRGSRKGPDLERALTGLPEHLPRILLSHQPQTVDDWPGRVALQLSGHTHGGQINPGVRPADLVFRYVAGLYTVGGTSLYVNRGLGTVGPPARVGAPPEVTRFVLVAA